MFSLSGEVKTMAVKSESRPELESVGVDPFAWCRSGAGVGKISSTPTPARSRMVPTVNGQ